ncbi:hypothetical protein BDN70DRAFT_672095 [Pholiota conissans]|uniref:F-box domain-containing protein n=1 Tax=Pholiota conissans TaxID=109636 RepID=A0A9P5Z4F0_9AGAR|nr:hypothetical protein BDN70DRAFT_672095 [Pholiota conissans]
MSGLVPPPILAVPVELGQHILSFCHPWDVAAFAQTCHAAYTLVYHPTDHYLWRQLYVTQFDVPKLSTSPSLSMQEKFEWKKELTSRMKVELVLFHGPASQAQTKGIYETLITVIEESCCIKTNASASQSRNFKWLKRVILNSQLLSNLYSQTGSEENAELHARLRSHLAMTLEDKGDKQAFKLLLDRRDKSRAFVYDLRNYQPQNKWGPFKTDGSVNWIHVEHLIDVISLNIRELPGSWASTRPPSILDVHKRPLMLSADVGSANDWAGVEGTWRRYVCFMDYRDLYAFNFTDLADGPRHPKFFKEPFREATRLIEVKLRLVPAYNMRFHSIPDDDNVLDQFSRFPPLAFSGTSKGVNGNEAAVEGYVVMGKDGILRWQLTSIYDNHPQWSSTGVQIGGPKSGMGIVGVWTTTHHDQDDPVGPFWLWKVEDDSPTHLMEFT